MTESWQIISPLEDLDYAQALPHELIDSTVSKIRAFNADLERRAVETLRAVNKWAIAEKLSSGWSQNSDSLFRDYFSVDGAAFRRKLSSDDGLNWKRAALLVHMSLALAEELMNGISEMPNARVANAKASVNPAAFELAHRHVTLASMVGALKSVQHELEMVDFALRALFGGDDGTQFVVFGTNWIFDAEHLPEQILLGYLPTGTQGLVNSIPAKSATVAAAVSRTFLESILFAIDFITSLSGAKQTEAEQWDEALAKLAQEGLVNGDERSWLKSMYGWLSLAVHSGESLSRGEVWHFLSLLRAVRQRIIERRGPQQRPSSAEGPGEPG